MFVSISSRIGKFPEICALVPAITAVDTGPAAAFTLLHGVTMAPPAQAVTYVTSELLHQMGLIFEAHLEPLSSAAVLAVQEAVADSSAK
jgi:hypothetical protein